MENKTNRDNSCQKVDFYTPVAPFYDILAGSFLRFARKGIVRGAEEQQCRRILDVACGTGEQAIMLAKEGLDVAAIDLSPAMLRVAREKSPPAIAYLLGNAEALPFGSGSFDCVTISLALHEMAPETRIRTTDEILRILTPGGKLIVFDYAALKDWKSAFGLSILGLLERIAGGEHFKNFVRFIQTGGIDQFLKRFPLKVVECRTFFMGAFRLVFSEKT